MQRIERCLDTREIEGDSVVGDDEFDLVQIRFESGLQSESAVHRLLQLRITLFQQAELPCVDRDEHVGTAHA